MLLCFGTFLPIALIVAAILIVHALLFSHLIIGTKAIIVSILGSFFRLCHQCLIIQTMQIYSDRIKNYQKQMVKNKTEMKLERSAIFFVYSTMIINIFLRFTTLHTNEGAASALSQCILFTPFYSHTTQCILRIFSVENILYA